MGAKKKKAVESPGGFNDLFSAGVFAESNGTGVVDFIKQAFAQSVSLAIIAHRDDAYLAPRFGACKVGLGCRHISVVSFALAISSSLNLG